jgi:isopentenyl diphosphate isomerase/L-lactate dehydrogenase-like FMN-dependent dehydrogenase
MAREEHIGLIYFGGLRTGTDVAKMLAMNVNAGVFGLAMGIAMGGSIQRGTLVFEDGRSVEELTEAANNWIKASVQETAIIARCTGKTNVHNLEPEDMRTITLTTRDAFGIPLASGGGARDYF